MQPKPVVIVAAVLPEKRNSFRRTQKGPLCNPCLASELEILLFHAWQTIDYFICVALIYQESEQLFVNGFRKTSSTHLPLPLPGVTHFNGILRHQRVEKCIELISGMFLSAENST